jgi:hypothetical protein
MTTHLTNQEEFGGANRHTLQALFRDTMELPPTIGITKASVGGVEQVTLTWSTQHHVNIDGIWLTLASGSILLNAGHVVNPTNYYVYIRNLNGVATVVVSTTSPANDPAVTYHYAWLSKVRMEEAANVSTVYYVRRSYTAIDPLLFNAGQWDLLNIPNWLDGGAISIDAATGEVDMSAVNYRRMRFEGAIAAITNGTILYGDEGGSSVNLETITSYRDGSPITAGKYIKLLFGVITSPILAFPFMVIRQSKPAVEYATRALALADAERVAGTSFPTDYRFNVIPLAYIVMLKGDASDLETVDLRGAGAGGGGGGGTPVANHSLLANLNADDHAQYLRTDGTRQLTGDMLVTAGKTVDGVDISVHAANATAHQNKVTLGADADVLLGLTDQQIDLDVQTANRVFAGPNAGVPADPTFRALVSDDIPALLAAKVSNFDEAAQDAVGGMLLSNNDVVLTYVDATPSLEATFKTTGELQVVLAAGANNDVAISTALLVYITGPAGAFNITGLSGGYAGRRAFLYNTTGSNMTITNESGGSIAANRIRELANTVTSGTGIVELVYSALASRWIVVGVHG